MGVNLLYKWNNRYQLKWLLLCDIIVSIGQHLAACTSYFQNSFEKYHYKTVDIINQSAKRIYSTTILVNFGNQIKIRLYELVKFIWLSSV